MNGITTKIYKLDITSGAKFQRHTYAGYFDTLEIMVNEVKPVLTSRDVRLTIMDIANPKAGKIEIQLKLKDAEFLADSLTMLVNYLKKLQ